MGRGAVPIRYFLKMSGTGTGPGTQSKKSHEMGRERLQNPGIGRFRDRILVPLNALVYSKSKGRLYSLLSRNLKVPRNPEWLPGLWSVWNSRTAAWPVLKRRCCGSSDSSPHSAWLHGLCSFTSTLFSSCRNAFT